MRKKTAKMSKDEILERESILRSLAADRGYSRTQLAKHLGISYQCLDQWIKRHMPDWDKGRRKEF